MEAVHFLPRKSSRSSAHVGYHGHRHLWLRAERAAKYRECTEHCSWGGRKSKAAKSEDKGRKERHVPVWTAAEPWTPFYMFYRVLVNPQQGKYFIWRCGAEKTSSLEGAAVSRKRQTASNAVLHPSQHMSTHEHGSKLQGQDNSHHTCHHTLLWRAFTPSQQVNSQAHRRLSLKNFLLWDNWYSDLCLKRQIQERGASISHQYQCPKTAMKTALHSKHLLDPRN